MIIFSTQEVSTHFCSSTSRIQVYLSSLGFGRDGGLSLGNTFGTCTLAYCGLCGPLIRKLDRWFGSFHHSNCVDIPPTRFLEQSSQYILLPIHYCQNKLFSAWRERNSGEEIEWSYSDGFKRDLLGSALVSLIFNQQEWFGFRHCVQRRLMAGPNQPTSESQPRGRHGASHPYVLALGTLHPASHHTQDAVVQKV